MELKYVVLTIIKIVISVPTVLLLHSIEVNGAALMGGHLDNQSNITNTNTTNSYLDDYDLYDSQEISSSTNSNLPSEKSSDSEEIPDPSPLVLPGYNLPENIFNKGKPFYLERDPLTGKVDFNSKSSVKLDDDLYDYVDDEPSSDNIYDKSNIDRKDGSLGSHRPSDVNQLTPNFHDFLNLPVKYNSDKYVYPLISSSYANTKIQGNVNKFQNHKNYNVKTSTYKPTASPTYYSSTPEKEYFKPEITTTTEKTTTTTKSVNDIYLTTKPTNLLDSNMGHPSYHEEFEDDYYESTSKSPNEIYLTTENVNNIYLTSKSPIVTTTTRRTMSLFEQLFGDYDETVTTTDRTKPPPLFVNLPSNKNIKTKYDGEVKTEKTSFVTPTTTHYPNSHAGPNVSNSGLDSSYEYEEDDNIAVENKPSIIIQNATTEIVPKYNVTEQQINTTDYSDYEFQETTTTTILMPPRVTSLPLGENHVTSLNNRQPIIVATQNLKEKLNSEKVQPKPFGFDKPPSTSNVHIAPDQDTVSFVVGNHQNVDGGQYVGTALKESPYDSNPFRPLYGQQATYSNKDTVSYSIQAPPSSEAPSSVSTVTIQPMKNSEASLSIGVPISTKGQVVDEKLEINNEEIEFPKGTGTKIVFPDDVKEESMTDLQPPPQNTNREVLQLSSKPMYHQLPSDLTPPKEKDVPIARPRPPWDPRPGHFYSGKPEYNRPPRPPPEIAYKRIDNLPNILPQFRPNMKPPHYFDNRLVRQPLLDRPNNRPIGFFEKLQPPPPPTPQQTQQLHNTFHNLRKIPPPPPQSLEDSHGAIAEDRIINDGPHLKKIQDHFAFYRTPPKVPIANRRNGDDDAEVETLQMIQAKNMEKKETIVATSLNTQENPIVKDGGTDKPLYVVYPVNTPPIKLDVIEPNKKESVVIGTRAELPLPPSKINKDFIYEQNPLLNPKDRNDSPVLKPHPRPSPTFPIKSDFPYPLERPDPSVIHPAVPETNNGNNLDELPISGNKFNDEPNFLSNQWNTIGENIESRIVNSKTNSNQISVTLKTYTEKPIAVAYTPTEPHQPDYNIDKFSLPNYASPVIPEIRPGTVDNADLQSSSNEFTVSAVMHTHPQNNDFVKPIKEEVNPNHKIDLDVNSMPPTQLDFQAPFQASVSIDSMNQGWSVVRDKNKTTTNDVEVTTMAIATTSEFDIENFKPQLEGGFKPIYSYPDDERKEQVNEREE